ncbi:hypothetical protein BDR07DRAFT_1423864 [Suillus spraguei]|nr:hypothetical protein BDR07DRAFT_1443738 [Suillus spraguei]KAG2355103.1 hypothetical protein BDR07DRAFT_1427311 [Suillus spraguei]KAG2356228.1 hypothetical protein BDR07DRAFT_1423864 [Suillus spraguei]
MHMNVMMLGLWCETQCSSQGTSRCAPLGHCMGSPIYCACRKLHEKIYEDDRKQLWWNGMDIRFLLNGRNLQP